METKPTPPQTLEENEELRGEAHDTDLPEEEGIPKSTTETPSAQEFVELSHQGFGVKFGSCVFNAAQLGDMAFRMFQLTKGEKPDEKTKSYLQ